MMEVTLTGALEVRVEFDRLAVETYQPVEWGGGGSPSSVAAAGLSRQAPRRGRPHHGQVQGQAVARASAVGHSHRLVGSVRGRGVAMGLTPP
jgi:hypothetical protein